MTIRYSSGAIFVLIVGILSVLLPTQASNPKPLACLADATDLVLYRWLHYDEPIVIEDWQWDELRQLDGRDIWLGYDNGGWDVPDGIRGRWKIIGQQYGERIEIWMWASTGDDYYYLFPVANNEMRYTSGEEHWGVHPCGGFEVNKLEVLNIIAKIQDNVDLWETPIE